MKKDKALSFGWKLGFQATVEHDLRLDVGEFTFKEDDLVNLLNAVEQATLERAAKECESVYFGNKGELSHEIAAHLRALKDSHD